MDASYIFSMVILAALCLTFAGWCALSLRKRYPTSSIEEFRRTHPRLYELAPGGNPVAGRIALLIGVIIGGSIGILIIVDLVRYTSNS